MHPAYVRNTLLLLLLTFARTSASPARLRGAAGPAARAAVRDETYATPTAPPFCAWRGNFDGAGSRWNIAYPDAYSRYHAMYMTMREGVEYRLRAASMPSARYFSVQTYDAEMLLPLGHLADYQVVLANASDANPYADPAAAAAQAPLAAYEVHVTASGTTGQYDNELPALRANHEIGAFYLFVRLYDASAAPPATLDLTCADGTSADGAAALRAWGYACAPVVEMRDANSADPEAWLPLRDCKEPPPPEHAIPADKRPAPQHHCIVPSNMDRNFFLPATLQTSNMWPNNDASYLMSCADTTQGATTGELWARVRARLPETPTSLYHAPYIAEGVDKGYDVRYVSLSTVDRAPPAPVHETIRDADIAEHYAVQMRSGNHHNQSKYRTWDRHYEVLIGPAGAAPPHALLAEAGMAPLRLDWPSKNGTADRSAVDTPGLLYRQILSQSQVVKDPTFHRAVHDIIPPVCAPGARGHGDDDSPWDPRKGGGDDDSPWDPRKGGGDGDDDDMTVADDDMTVGYRCMGCCGEAAPACCNEPTHCEEVMHAEYPVVEYFYVDPESRTATAATGV